MPQWEEEEDKENLIQIQKQTQTQTQTPIVVGKAKAHDGIRPPSNAQVKSGTATAMTTTRQVHKAKEPEEEPDNEHLIYERKVDADGRVAMRMFKRGKFLGKGGFARCYEMTCQQTDRVYAGKIVPKSLLVKPKAKQKFTSEIKIHKSLDHPRIVKFEHFFEDATNSYILLELCENQSMAGLLRRRKRLSEPEVRYFMRQLAQGLVYLHANLVIHRDLKLGNLFVTQDMQLKIGDFGLATRLENLFDRKKTMCGTPNYIAPEVLDGQKGAGHSFEVDIWSTGVIMYTLLVGKPPFETNQVKDTYRRIRANQYSFPDDLELSPNAKRLIIDILKVDPLERPSLDAILAHSFMQEHPLPSSLPRTAMILTPPAKRVIATTKQRRQEMPTIAESATSKSGSQQTATGVAGQGRQPLRSRDLNHQQQDHDQDRISGSSRPSRSSKSSSVASTTSSSVNGNKIEPHRSSSSSTRSKPKETPPPNTKSKIHLPESDAPTEELASNGKSPFETLQLVFEALDRIFFLQEHDEHDQKLSEFSSTSAIVAAAKRLKELRVENDSRNQALVVQADLWVAQWVDYTSKYGMGYILSNGSAGVYFNDSTKIICSCSGDTFDYLERHGDHTPQNYQVNYYDRSLTKKVTLLTHFKNYLVENQEENDELERLRVHLTKASREQEQEADNTRKTGMVFVTKWMKTRHAILFCLSNDTFQFNFFDSSKLILSSNGRVVTYLDKNGDLECMSTSIAVFKSERTDLLKRLRYIRDMLHQLLKVNGTTPVSTMTSSTATSSTRAN